MDQPPLYLLPPNGLRYQAERRRPSWYSRLHYIGVPLEGGRRYVFAAMLMVFILGTAWLVLGPVILRPFTGRSWTLSHMAQGRAGVRRCRIFLGGPGGPSADLEDRADALLAGALERSRATDIGSHSASVCRWAEGKRDPDGTLLGSLPHL